MNDILVTGAPRSGTTIIGKLLALPPEVGYVREPFNVDYGLAGLPEQFAYIHSGMHDEALYRTLTEDLLAGHAHFRRLPADRATTLKQRLGRALFRGGSAFSYFKATHNPRVKRLLLKDPMACLASEYLYREFDVQTLILVRHPGAFVASMQRLHWSANLSSLSAQPELMHDYLSPILTKTALAATPGSARELALLWRCLMEVLHVYAGRNPQMVVLRHEDFSADPLGTMRTLYARFGLAFTPAVQREVEAYTGTANPTDPEADHAHTLKRNSGAMIARWQRLLSKSEIRTIKEITQPVATLYYDEQSWGNKNLPKK